MVSVATIEYLKRKPVTLFILVPGLTAWAPLWPLLGYFGLSWASLIFFPLHFPCRASLAEDLMWFLLKQCVLLIGTVPGSA